jgi:DNA-binding NtrC family response regulator
MPTPRKAVSEETLRAIRMFADRMAEMEESYKVTRAAERALLLQAITQEGMSVAAAAKMSGHNRKTITVWLQIYNAEKKA